MEEGLLADVTGLSTPSLLKENEDLTHVLNVLCAGGYGAWVVGGAVRDSLLGKIPHEYDICTTATPDEVIESFDDTIPTGVKFGTITVKVAHLCSKLLLFELRLNMEMEEDLT